MSRGGKRPNAGRPKGTGKYGEQTKPIRIPVSKLDEVMALLLNENDNSIVDNKIYKAAVGEEQLRPLYSSKVSAGQPTPATSEIEDMIDLNQYLLAADLDSAYFVRANGESMIDIGIYPGDLLVIDSNLPAKSGKIVIALVNGELTVKRLRKEDDKIYLVPENSKFEIIEVTEEMDFKIWGVVTNAIHKI